MPGADVQKAMITWVVAAALIDDNGQVLVQKRAAGRSMAGLWEFPGGKVELNERPEDAIVRELGEELGIVVAPQDVTPFSFASAPLGERHLLLLLYVCRKWLGVPTALDADALQWSSVEGLQTLAMPPADVPLVNALVTQQAMVPTRS
jgi:8-oxo-dGTP diphosphatase